MKLKIFLFLVLKTPIYASKARHGQRSENISLQATWYVNKRVSWRILQIYALFYHILQLQTNNLHFIIKEMARKLSDFFQHVIESFPGGNIHTFGFIQVLGCCAWTRSEYCHSNYISQCFYSRSFNKFQKKGRKKQLKNIYLLVSCQRVCTIFFSSVTYSKPLRGKIMDHRLHLKESLI